MTLIEQLERAEGGSRELDLAICLALDTGRRTDPRDPGPDHFTTSIDAALTLVSVEWDRIEFGRYEDTPDRFWAYFQGVENEAASENCATIALAICIAALRARREGE